ncbi:MAG TPA: Fe(3+)-dicitrate ABC transporter ATP-binding protein, partial [Leclercia adecarboxylata]|nr:Fe(3+)-dicitrate ABC transporter ATP-binding protein [Leclercia adecarboxylata]
WIAMVLAQQTPLLLLDEPTTWLDIAHQIELLELMQDLNQQHGRTLVVVLHDLNLAALWADRIVLLHEGRIVSQGTPPSVLQADDLTRWYGAQVHVGLHPLNSTPQVFLAP